MAASDPAITELTAQLKELTTTLKASGAEAAKAKGAVGGVGDESGKAASGVGKLGGAFQHLAAQQMSGALDAFKQFLADIPEAAARGDAHARTLQRLGGAYDEVTRATNGAVTAEQASRVQQTLAQAGLTLTARELADVTKRAREYSLATGTEMSQALDQMTDALRGGEAEGLRRFGITIAAGTSKANAMAEALRQIGAQARTAGTSALTLAESQEQYNRALGESKDAASLALAQYLHLNDFYRSAADWLTQLTTSTDGWSTALRAIPGMIAEIHVPDFVRDALDAAHLGGAARSARDYMRGVGQGGAAPNQGHLNPANPDDIGSVDLSAIAASVNARTAARTATELRRTELARIARGQAAPGGGAAHHAAAADVAEVEGPLTAFIRRANEVVAEFERAGAERAGVRDRRSSARMEASGRRIEDTNNRFDERLADAQNGLGASGTFDPMGGDAQNRTARERITILREQREALIALHNETDAQLATARATGAPENEVNDLLRQRIGLAQAVAGVTRDLTAAQREQTSALDSFKDGMTSALSGVADGFGAAAVAAIEGTKSFSDAMAELLRNTLRSLAQESIVQALKNTALGIAALVTAPAAAPGFFAAAGAWAAVGIASGVGLAAMPRPSTAGVGAGASGGGAARADLGPARADRTQGGGLTLNLTVSGSFFETRDQVYEGMAHGIREARARGYDLGEMRLQ